MKQYKTPCLNLEEQNLLNTIREYKTKPRTKEEDIYNYEMKGGID